MWLPLPTPIVVLSPHPDDAVLSCADLLCLHPGTAVLTVFAGVSDTHSTLLTEWDQRSGFHSAAEAVAARRQEDAEALGLLGAKPYWLGFSDAQYAESPTDDALFETLRTHLIGAQPAALVLPCGLFHSDHVLVHAAALRLMPLLPDTRFVLYEEALYRSIRGAVQQRLAALLAAGLLATPALPPPEQDAAAKRAAMRCYSSQARALQKPWPDWDTNLTQPERYWLLEAIPDSTPPTEAHA